MRFNGATTFQPWKYVQPDEAPGGLSKLQWGHDFSAVEINVTAVPDPVSSSFNGATTFQPWKSPGCSHSQTLPNKLQWGHDFSAVEIEGMVLLKLASSMLQWGHDFSAVEM